MGARLGGVYSEDVPASVVMCVSGLCRALWR
jgi:hypothetical protein